jgi:hypothetical protein
MASANGGCVMKKNTAILLIFLLVGLVLGGVIGDVLKNILPILNYHKSIGVEPFMVDLAILNFTLGFSMQISLASILGLLIGLFLYKRI